MLATTGMADAIWRYPPGSIERYQLFRQLVPREGQAPHDALVVKAIQESTNRGTGVLLGPRIEAVGTTFLEFAWACVEYERTRTSSWPPKEWNAFNDACNKLHPYLATDAAAEQPPAGEETAGAGDTDGQTLAGAAETRGEADRTLENQVSQILKSHDDLTSENVASQLVKKFKRTTTASTVRTTKAWRNRRRQTRSASLPPSGTKSVDGDMEAEGEGPTADHYTILEAWQERKEQEPNAKWPPKTTWVIDTLRDKRDPNDVPVSEDRAHELRCQTESHFNFGDD